MKLLPIERKVSGCNRWPHSLVFEIVAYAKVDDELYPFLVTFRWTLDGSGYPIRHSKGTIILLHRQVANFGEVSAGMVDHEDGDKLNAQIENLRPADRSNNMANSKLYRNSKTGFKGVCWNAAVGKYQAQIKVNGKIIYLGLSDDPKDGARVYDLAAVKYFGEFARTNKALGIL